MDMDYRTAVNSTYFTAQQTSFFLMQAQNEDAKTFIQTLSLANQFMKKLALRDFWWVAHR